MKNLLFLYFSMPLFLIMEVFLFEVVLGGGLFSDADPSAAYAFSMATVLVSLSSMVLTYTYFKNNPVFQITFLNLSAFLVLLDYYYYSISTPDSANLLWLLPMIAVVYVSRYNAVKTFNKEK